MRLAIFGALLMLAATAWNCAAGEEGVEAALAGLDGVTLHVEAPDSSLVRRGITQDVIQTPVELLLRQNGIPVLNEGDPGNAAGNPVLYVLVVAVVDEVMQQYAYQIQMELTQTVILERDPQSSIDGATTWRTGGMALSGPQWRTALLTDLDTLTRAFVEAYLVANGEG